MILDQSALRIQICHVMARTASQKQSRRASQNQCFRTLDTKPDDANGGGALRTMLREWRHAPCFTEAKSQDSRSSDDLQCAEKVELGSDGLPMSDGQTWAALVLTLHRDGRFDLQRIKSQKVPVRRPKWDSRTVGTAALVSQARPDLSTLAKAYLRTSKQLEVERLQLSQRTALANRAPKSLGSANVGRTDIGLAETYRTSAMEVAAKASSSRPSASDVGPSVSNHTETTTERKPRKRWQVPSQRAALIESRWQDNEHDCVAYATDQAGETVGDGGDQVDSDTVLPVAAVATEADVLSCSASEVGTSGVNCWCSRNLGMLLC